ncbi:gluconokinase [Geitlerinema sp. PCC 9228]|jgi:gluconokinase|uniref:gluconokinase n=1 Tax=Geitlerinema sp. PCC 9228 TaxID=111611 RepID=UPI0008F9E1AC|nr:gluconokinase [Geitlerinema sp. PCC 9228]
MVVTAPIFVVMGVSGVGKTSVGQLLARRLRVEFIEGDDFHPPENIAKMENGIPLTDRDRYPWLLALRQKIDTLPSQGKGGVVACSALKENYREILSGGGTTITWIFLEGARSLLQQRLKRRQGHFMTAELLDSQLATLEPPQTAMVENVEKPVEEIVASILCKCQMGNFFSQNTSAWD